jgi:glycine hydroxymethyltransferase
MTISGFDPELQVALDGEQRRQEDHIELIARPRTTPARACSRPGLGADQQYAEGYPGKRYYGGCEYVDMAEQLAIDRAKKLFGPRTRTCSRTRARRRTPPRIRR